MSTICTTRRSPSYAGPEIEMQPPLGHDTKEFSKTEPNQCIIITTSPRMKECGYKIHHPRYRENLGLSWQSADLELNPRRHSRIEIQTLCRRLWEVNDVEEFKQAFIDIIEAHFHLFTSGHTVHGNISPENLAFQRSSDNTIRGVLYDIDNAVPRGLTNKSEYIYYESLPPHRRIRACGTIINPMFLPLPLHQSALPFRISTVSDTYWCYSHDLESFFWVLLWYTLCTTLVGKPHSGTHRRLSDRFYLDHYTPLSLVRHWLAPVLSHPTIEIFKDGVVKECKRVLKWKRAQEGLGLDGDLAGAEAPWGSGYRHSSWALLVKSEFRDVLHEWVVPFGMKLAVIDGASDEEYNEEMTCCKVLGVLGYRQRTLEEMKRGLGPQRQSQSQPRDQNQPLHDQQSEPLGTRELPFPAVWIAFRNH